MMPIRHFASIGIAAFAGATELLQPVTAIGPTDETVAWLMRGLLGIGLLACAYLLRDAARTMKETKKEVSDLAIIVATHNIMFEHWIDNLGTDDIDNPGRRKSDSILKLMLAQSQQTTKEKLK